MSGAELEAKEMMFKLMTTELLRLREVETQPQVTQRSLIPPNVSLKMSLDKCGLKAA